MQNPVSLGPAVEPSRGDCCALLGQRFIMKPADLAVRGQERAVTLKGKREGLSTRTLDYNASPTGHPARVRGGERLPFRSNSETANRSPAPGLWKRLLTRASFVPVSGLTELRSDHYG